MDHGALDRTGGRIGDAGPIDFVHVRHAEMAAFMACAHAKLSGDVGVCLASSGPGVPYAMEGAVPDVPAHGMPS